MQSRQVLHLATSSQTSTALRWLQFTSSDPALSYQAAVQAIDMRSCFKYLLLLLVVMFAASALPTGVWLQRPAAASGNETLLLPDFQVPLDNLSSPFICHYGRDEGIWRNSHKPGSRWLTLDPACPLRNLLPPPVPTTRKMKSKRKQKKKKPPPPSPPPPPPPPLQQQQDILYPRILFLSDSIDLNAVDPYCKSLGGKMRGEFKNSRPEFLAAAALPSESNKHKHPKHIRHHYVKSNICDSPTPARLLHTFLFSASPQGPFWQNMSIPYTYKLEDASLVWKEYSDQPPELAVISLTAWEEVRLQTLHKNDTAYMQEMPLAMLREFAFNLSGVFQATRAAFPGVPILYHSHALFVHDEHGQHLLGHGCHISHIVELNAYGLATAAALGCETMDLQLMVQRFGHPHAYLSDPVHLKPWCLTEVLNVYLNYVADGRRQQTSTGLS